MTDLEEEVLAILDAAARSFRIRRVYPSLALRASAARRSWDETMMRTDPEPRITTLREAHERVDALLVENRQLRARIASLVTAKRAGQIDLDIKLLLEQAVERGISRG